MLITEIGTSSQLRSTQTILQIGYTKGFTSNKSSILSLFEF